MYMKNLLTGTLAAASLYLATMTSGFVGEKQKYYFMVFSNLLSIARKTFTSNGMRDSTFMNF